MEVRRQCVEQIIVSLTEEEAEKLFRLCSLSSTIQDHVTATVGEPYGVAMAEFLSDLEHSLKAHGVE
jgi:hypothetical protein